MHKKDNDTINCKISKFSQSGRSMVEMLGTLAIIGVLSIGGIAGYNYGINKYRANTIINDIMLRATDAIAQFDATGDANLSEWSTITAGQYTIGLEDDTIGIQIDGLPKDLCQMVYEGMKNHADIKFNATIYEQENDTLECGDINTMVFYVEDTINIGRGEQLPDQTECSTNKECQTEDVCMGCVIPDGQESGFCEYACQELEWIGNDGSSYIFVPLKTNAKDIVEVEQEVQYTDTSFNQAEIKNGSPYFFMGIDGSLNWYAGTGGYGSSGIKADTNWHTMRLVSYGDNHGFWLDGNRLYKGSTNDGTYLSSGLGLWYTVGGNWRTLNRKKYVKITVNGDIVYSFTPVLDPEGVPAILDTVENKLYYNQGSGQFTYNK